jgi:hypothetical protein
MLDTGACFIDVAKSDLRHTEIVNVPDSGSPDLSYSTGVREGFKYGSL